MTVDTVWLRRLYVLFFISIGTRGVEDVASTTKPEYDTAGSPSSPRASFWDVHAIYSQQTEYPIDFRMDMASARIERSPRHR